jgi:hypothetical protein
MKKPIFADLHKLPEDERIKIIAHHVIAHKARVGFVTDDEPDKPQRYIRKLEALHPGVFNFETLKGPSPKTVSIVVTLKPNPSNN